MNKYVIYLGDNVYYKSSRNRHYGSDLKSCTKYSFRFMANMVMCWNWPYALANGSCKSVMTLDEAKINEVFT